MKLYCNGSIKNNEIGGLGFILRNDISDPLFARCRCAERRSVLYYEAIACQDWSPDCCIGWSQINSCEIRLEDIGSGSIHAYPYSLDNAEFIEDIWYLLE